MSTSFLRIDQDGLPEGTPGRSRTDGKADGTLVTLTDTSPGSGSTEFLILWAPPGDTDAVSSLDVTEDPKVWTFAPTPGKYGTYLVELVRNAGLLVEARERRVIVMRTPNLGLIIPALGERGDPAASLEESLGAELVDNNATDFADPDLNELPFAAWWRAMHELITQVDGGAGVVVTHYSGTGLARKAYASLAEALAANYPSSIPSVAVYDIPPNLHNLTPGPITLDQVVHYVLRSVAGRGSVSLPELANHAGGSWVSIEGCIVGLPINISILFLRDSDVNAAFACEGLDARDSKFSGAGGVGSMLQATFDRCVFFECQIVCTAPTEGSLTIANCTFPSGGLPPTIEFTGDPGVVRMDARSNFLWAAAGGSVTNGTIVVEALP